MSNFYTPVAKVKVVQDHCRVAGGLYPKASSLPVRIGFGHAHNV